MRLSAKFEGKSTSDGRSVQPTTKANLRSPENRIGSAPSPAARNLALAHHIERLIERGVIADYTAAAQMLSVSQPRMTHIMSLLLLAPAIQDAILFGGIAPKDKELRGLARVNEWGAQALRFRR